MTHVRAVIYSFIFFFKEKKSNPVEGGQAAPSREDESSN